MARILKREPAKRDLIAQWIWYAENASTETAYRIFGLGASPQRARPELLSTDE